jgi:peptidoglycan/LPS O-acetylase OafA/YrhL
MKSSSTEGSPSHLSYLDGWRGIAIILVLLHHFAGLEAGDIGVQVFFVLSGKLMSQVLFVDRTPLGVFYRRRVARVFPLFYLYLSVFALASLMLSPERPLGELIYTATFFRTYLPGQSIWDLVLPTGHLWSLNIEEHSYVLLSLVALVMTRLGPGTARIALPVVTSGCLVAYAYYSARPPSLLASPAMLRSECAAFALMLSASLHLWLRRPSLLQFWLALIAVLTLFALHVFGTRAHNVVKLVLLPGALALLINVVGAGPKFVHVGLSAQWLRWFGVVSFSLYIWQQLFLWLSMRDHMSQAQGAVMAIGAGSLSYYYFEAPLRSLIRNGVQTTRQPMSSAKVQVVSSEMPLVSPDTLGAIHVALPGASMPTR